MQFNLYITGSLPHACRYGPVEAVQRLVERQLRPPSPNALSLGLASACRGSNADIISYLVERGGPGIITSTVLEIACQGGDLEIVRFLVEQAGTGIINHTCLESACLDANMDMIQFLVDAGGLNIITTAALHNACLGGSLAVVKHLLQLDSSLSVCTPETASVCLELALQGMHQDVVEFLVQRAGPAIIGTASLNEVCEQCKASLQLAKFLVEQAGPGIIKASTMDSACYGGHMETLQYLVQQAGPGIIDDVALATGCQGGDLAVVSFLVQQAGPGIISSTALVAALSESHTDIAMFLVEQAGPGIINGADRHGETPLHAAVATGDVDMVAFLVERGADMTATSYQGRTPLEHACIYMDLEAISDAVPQYLARQMALVAPEQLEAALQYLRPKEVIQLCVSLCQASEKEAAEHKAYKAREAERLHTVQDLTVQMAIAAKRAAAGWQAS